MSTSNAGQAGSADIVAIGHALVDVLCHADDAFLDHNLLVKGSMELVDGGRAVPLYEQMCDVAAGRGESLLEMSGGSAANTAVVAAMLGAPTAFFGKVRDDDLGRTFARDLQSVGVRFATERAGEGSLATGRCLINVTADAERTMCTFLGAARGLRVPDMDPVVLSTAKVTYLEGYLWDEPLAREGLYKAIEIVHSAGQRFSITLSDSFLVDRFRDELLELLPSSVDILFANEHEICSLFETDFDSAVSKVAPMCEIATITRGKHGSLVLRDGEVISVPASDVEVVDTTGAGDAYAGGFLYGFTQGRDLARCAEIGNLAAGEVISQLGARPGPKLYAAVHG